MIYKRIREEEAATEKDFALLVLFDDFGAQRDDVGDKSIIILLREAVHFHA